MTEDNLYLDSTHIKANANKHKFTKEMTHDEAKAYQDELEDEINKERIAEGKRPFTWDTESELSLQKISHSDPESGYYVKGKREKQLLILHILPILDLLKLKILYLIVRDYFSNEMKSILYFFLFI